MAQKTIEAMKRLQENGKLDAAMGRKQNNTGVMEIDISSIKPDPEQPRKAFDQVKLNELASNIEKHGVLQAIVVQPPNADGIHTIIMGERRFRAATQAGLKKIPAMVKEVTPELRAIQLSENIQRQELTTMEIALAVDQMRVDGRSRKDIAKALGWSEAQISLFNGVLKMEPELQELARCSVQVRALADLQKLWKQNHKAVEEFIANTEAEDITRIAVEKLKQNITQCKEAEEQGGSSKPDDTNKLQKKATSSKETSVDAQSSSSQIVFLCKQGDGIGRLLTDRPASSRKAVMVSFDNGERIIEIPLSEINLVEAVTV